MKELALASALRDAVSVLHKRLRKQVYSGEGYSITEFTTLSYLYTHASLFPSELAAFTRIKAQSMSQVLKKLETDKLIQRTGSRQDKRKTLVSLTAKGKKAVEKTRYERDEWLAGALQATMKEKDFKTLAAALPLLQRIAAFE